MVDTVSAKKIMPSVEMIWTQLRSRLLAFINGRVNNTAIAEDLLQDVFLKIHRNIHTLNNPARVESWVYQIARNTLIDYYRRQRPGDALPDELTADEDSNAQLQQRLSESLHFMSLLLPEKYREAVILSDFQNVPQVEAAERLSISYSTYKSRVQRGRQMLREMWQECCHFEFDRRGTIIDYHSNTCSCCGDTDCDS
ncbi:MAG: RNA polymerase sigma factor SigZ [Calditrichia bacterium]